MARAVSKRGTETINRYQFSVCCRAPASALPLLAVFFVGVLSCGGSTFIRSLGLAAPPPTSLQVMAFVVELARFLAGGVYLVYHAAVEALVARLPPVGGLTTAVHFVDAVIG